MGISDCEIEIRECKTVEEFSACVEVQREAFGVNDIDLLPRRYFVAARSAGGWTLGAFAGNELVGFVVSLNAYLYQRRAYYSHLAGMRKSYEGRGIGARLKWAQRERALSEGVTYIKWALDPAKARNAYFSIEKLGGIVRKYKRNYQGADFIGTNDPAISIALDSDRVFVEWHLDSERVKTLVAGQGRDAKGEVRHVIPVPNDWSEITTSRPLEAIAVRNRIRIEFEIAQSKNLICSGFRFADHGGEYLFYRDCRFGDSL